jgi:capsular exopolysaccharide synthesis family protein
MGYAMTLAQQGIKTLLIDADISSPSLERALLGTVNLSGLAQILEGTDRMESAAVRTSIHNLDLLPAGSRMGEASELLADSVVHNLLRTAKAQYECIVIDSPPIQSAGDSLILAECVDSICLIVRYAKTEQKQVSRALRLLNEQESKIEGVVFNAANIRLLPEYPSIGGAMAKVAPHRFQPA